MSVASDVAGGARPAPNIARRAPFSRRTLLIAGAAVIAATGGVALIFAPKSSESTEAAYIQADSSVIAPKVRGLVDQVLVRHDQVVKRGDPLITIDPEEFEAKVAMARADLTNAEAAVASANAALVSLTAEEVLSGANVRAAQTLIAAADAESARASADRARYDNLISSGAVARRDADQYRAAEITARSGADRRRAELEVSRDQARVTRARRATLQAAVVQAEAGVARARAALDLASQDRDHATIRAPINGVVGDRQAEPGEYVQPGARLMTIVPMNALFVVANFKETQVSRMEIGQSASIKVDALPGTALSGKVESLAPGSGSQFALLPFEPGSGNFTKIVQRVPVRIRIDPDQKGLDRLRPGLSTTVTVQLKGS